MTNTPPPSARLPLEYYEEAAAGQRLTIHNSVSRLRVATKARLDLRRNLAHYFWPAAAAVSLVGLCAGYNFTGIFTER